MFPAVAAAGLRCSLEMVVFFFRAIQSHVNAIDRENCVTKCYFSKIKKKSHINKIGWSRFGSESHFDDLFEQF